MVAVYRGDEFIDVMSYEDFCHLAESDPWYSFEWCEGYGP